MCLLLATVVLPSLIQHLVEVEAGIEGRSVISCVTRSPRDHILIDLLKFEFPR